MIQFITGLVLFFGVHLFSAFRSREPGKDIKARLGNGPFMGLYSLISLAGFVLLIMGFGAMRPAPVLYNAPAWSAMLSLVLMLPVLVIFVSSQMPAGHIKKFFKHPMLVSVKIWAVLHLLSNGELNSVILFGAFLAYAIIDRIAVKKRGDMGAANAIPKLQWDIWAIVIGVVLYLAFVMKLHGLLFGVVPVS